MPNIRGQPNQKIEIDEICKDFIQKGNAFYHPVTKKLSYIVDGYCIKGECSNRKKSVNKGFGDRKILMPLQIRKDFKTKASGVCALPLEKIGKVVICLSHFFLEHQKSYLKDGFMPPEARLVTQGENGHEGEPPPASEFTLRDCAKGANAWRGCKIAVREGLVNEDWVNSIVFDFHFFIASSLPV